MERPKEIINRYSRTEQIIPGSLVVDNLAVSALHFWKVGEEIAMDCTQRDDGSLAFKYVDSLVGPSKVYFRLSGGWADFSNKVEGIVVTQNDIDDRSLVQAEHEDKYADKYDPRRNLHLGNKYRKWNAYGIDFEIPKFIEKRWYTKADGSWLHGGKGGIRVNPWIQDCHYICKNTIQNSCRRYDDRRQVGLLNNDIENQKSVVNDTKELDKKLVAVALMVNKKVYTPH